MVRKLIVVAVVVILSSSIYAQRLGDLPSSSSYTSEKSSFSLFDPNRFHMSHSYSLMYASSNAGSYSMGMYLNSIEYQISDPLQIKLDIGYVHRPGAFFSNGSNAVTDGQILPGVSINWRPSKNLLFHFAYRQVPAYYNYFNSESNNQYYPKGEGH